MRWGFIILFLILIGTVSASEIVNIDITNVCDFNICGNIEITLKNNSNSSPIFYVWTSDNENIAYDEKGINKERIDTYDVDLSGYQKYDTSFCIETPKTNVSHKLYVKTYYDGYYYSDLIDYSNNELNCENFTKLGINKETLFRKILHYPIVRIPYDKEGNIFNDVDDVNPSKIFKITFANGIYFLGVVLFILYLIISFSEKY